MAKRKSKTQEIDLEASSERDQCQTPDYGTDTILPYLKRFKRIWEPCTGQGQMANHLERNGLKVIRSDILTGQNFFKWEPEESWDALVTNPPYSVKYFFIERCYRLNKPFALLIPLETLGAWGAQKWMRDYGVEVMLLNRRINFRMPKQGYSGKGANFPVIWFCRGILPKETAFTYGTVIPRPDGQMELPLAVDLEPVKEAA